MYVVYEISCNLSDRTYIGSTKNLQKRFKQHLTSLQKGTHHSVFFQRFYDKNKDNIELYVNVLSEHKDETSCKESEEKVINENYDNLFNVSKRSTGGDLLTYHPQFDHIKQKISKTLRRKHADGEIVPSSQAGELNGNYRHGQWVKVHAPCSECKKDRIVHQAQKDILCQSCTAKKRTGEKNSFYGKTHSSETRDKLSKARKARVEQMNKEGKVLPRAVPVFVQGVYYTSSSVAAKQLGLLTSTLNYRVRSNNWEYRSYYYAHKPKKFEDLKLCDKDSTVLIDGVEYSSVDTASEILNIPRSTILYRCHAETEEMKNYVLKRPTSIESEYQKVFS